MSRKKLPSKIATGATPIQDESDSIQSLFGFKSPYTHKTREEYEIYLNDLSISDLQRHSVEHGVIPSVVSRTVLINRLIGQFLKNKISHINKQVEQTQSTLSQKDESDVAKLLASVR